MVSLPCNTAPSYIIVTFSPHLILCISHSFVSENFLRKRLSHIFFWPPKGNRKRCAEHPGGGIRRITPALGKLTHMHRSSKSIPFRSCI